MGDKELDHTRRLRSDYGSLLYACRPYPGMKPYVKVLDYNSICGVPIETSGWKLHPYSGAYDEVREKLLPNQKLFSVCCRLCTSYEPYLYGTGEFEEWNDCESVGID